MDQHGQLGNPPLRGADGSVTASLPTPRTGESKDANSAKAPGVVAQRADQDAEWLALTAAGASAVRVRDEPELAEVELQLITGLAVIHADRHTSQTATCAPARRSPQGAGGLAQRNRHAGGSPLY